MERLGWFRGLMAVIGVGLVVLVAVLLHQEREAEARRQAELDRMYEVGYERSTRLATDGSTRAEAFARCRKSGDPATMSDGEYARFLVGCRDGARAG